MMQKKYSILSIILLFAFCVYARSQQTNRPNVIFIICDDLNDYEGIFGGHPQAKTPNIDKLATSGIQFVNAYSNTPVCCPSRNSLFTGVYSHVSKDFGWTKLKQQATLAHNKTIMELFRENGYKTYGTGKLTHDHIPEVWDEWGMKVAHNYGPLYFDGKDRTANPSVPEPFRSIGPIDGSFGRLSDAGISPGINGDKGWIYGQDGTPFKYINDNDRDKLQDEKHVEWAVNTLKKMDSTNSSIPFFMGVGFVRPHTPMHVPDKYFDLFPLGSLIPDKWIKNDVDDTYYTQNISNENKGPRYYQLLLNSFKGDRELAIKKFLQAYLAAVAFIDVQVGLLIAGLNETQFRNNTIIVFTSDHGWQMGEKDYLFKNTVWEESTRIPLIIKSPQGKTGLKIKNMVSLIDLFPTLADMCSLKGSNKIDSAGGSLGGYTLTPFISGNPSACRGPSGALSMVGNFGINTSVEQQNYSYRTAKWRYIRYSSGQEELYDHTTDPYEWINHAGDIKYKAIISQLGSEMQKIIDSNMKNE